MLRRSSRIVFSLTNPCPMPEFVRVKGVTTLVLSVPACTSSSVASSVNPVRNCVAVRPASVWGVTSLVAFVPAFTSVCVAIAVRPASVLGVMILVLSVPASASVCVAMAAIPARVSVALTPGSNRNSPAVGTSPKTRKLVPSWIIRCTAPFRICPATSSVPSGFRNEIGA